MGDYGPDPALVNQAPAGLGPLGFDLGQSERTPSWIILPDRNIAIRMEPHEYHLDFTTYEAAFTTYYKDNRVVEERWEIGDSCESKSLAEWQDASWEMRGGLKWDGCINWETNPECMMHGCGMGHPDDVADTLRAIYAFGAKWFEYLGDEPPAMPEEAVWLPA